MALNVEQIPNKFNDFNGMKIMVHDLDKPLSNNTEMVEMLAFLQIPKLHVERAANDSDGILVHYKNETNRLWHKYNPEIILVRYKSSRKNFTKNESIYTKKRKASKRNGWVITSDAVDAENGRWDGWKHFGGKHSRVDDTFAPINPIDPALRRTWFKIYGNTEIWENEYREEYVQNNGIYLNLNWQPYNRLLVPLNVNIFTYNYDLKMFDVGFDGIDRNDYLANGHRLTGTRRASSFFPQNTMEYQLPVGSMSISTRIKKTQMHRFKFVIGIDNPLATKTNGLPPKIFGPESDIFFTRNYCDGNMLSNGQEIGKRYFQTNITRPGV
jgi:hypothetical protein